MRQPGPCARALCEAVAVLLSKNMTCAIALQCNARRTFSSDFTMRSSHPALHTSRSTLHPISNHESSSHLISPHLSSSHLIPSLLTCHLSKLFSKMHLHRKAFTKYFVLQSLHKALLPVLLCTIYRTCTQDFCTILYYEACTKAVPSTTLYYKDCTKHVPVLLCTTNRAQSTSQYILLCTTKLALCTTKLAQSTFQYYFVLQDAHKYFPVLLCTTKLAQSTSQYYFVRVHNIFPTHIKLLRAATFYTEKLLHTTSFYTRQAFAHSNR